MKDISLEAAIQRSGIGKDYRTIIETNSRGVYGFTQFADYVRVNREKLKRRAVSLGLDLGPVRAVNNELDLEFGNYLLPRLKSQSLDHFMGTIAKWYAPVYFFVPPRILTHQWAYRTRDEFLWCVSNPGQLGNFDFVFGLHEYSGDQIKQMLRVTT